MKISFVNMPFAALDAPSLALTQLSFVLKAEFGSAVESEVLYLNHDFGKFFGPTMYREIALRSEHLYSGLGDWLFRNIAFPDSPDNVVQYLQRFYPRLDSHGLRFRELLLERRSGLDCFLDRLIDDYKLLDADIIGLTSMFAQSVACYALAHKLKAIRPDLVIVMGGANCEGSMGRTIAANVSDLDFIVSGPGLKSFPELVRQLQEGDARGDAISGVFPGVARTGGTDLVPTSLVDLGEELPIDTPVALDYGPFLNAITQRYPNGEVKPVLLFETSRGCWWGQKSHCTFCGLNGSTMQYRSMPAELALAQFQHLFEYADRCKELSCVDNILPKSYLRDVLPRVKTPPGVNIFYEVKADLSEEEVGTLARAGVRTVQPGIESLATSTLKLMRKGTSVFTNLRMLMHCRLFEVAPMWNLLMGSPGEELEVFQQYLINIPLIAHLAPPTGAFPVRFDRFSPYFERMNEYNLDLQPLDMYEYVYPFSPSTLKDLAYYFADRHYDASYQIAMLTMLRSIQDAVVHWRDRYSGFDGGQPADLFVLPDTDGRIVFDSRRGERNEYSLSDCGACLLKGLTSAANIRELSVQGLSNSEVEAGIAELREHQLIFEEGNRAMSIVLSRVTHRGELLLGSRNETVSRNLST